MTKLREFLNESWIDVLNTAKLSVASTGFVRELDKFYKKGKYVEFGKILSNSKSKIENIDVGDKNINDNFVDLLYSSIVAAISAIELDMGTAKDATSDSVKTKYGLSNDQWKQLEGMFNIGSGL